MRKILFACREGVDIFVHFGIVCGTLVAIENVFGLPIAPLVVTGAIAGVLYAQLGGLPAILDVFNERCLKQGDMVSFAALSGEKYDEKKLHISKGSIQRLFRAPVDGAYREAFLDPDKDILQAEIAVVGKDAGVKNIPANHIKKML